VLAATALNSLPNAPPALRRLISGRKAFQRPMAEGVKLLNAIQDVYLCKDVTVA